MLAVKTGDCISINDYLSHFNSIIAGLGLMGRVRGKGKKLTLVTSNEDAGSGGEEVLPVYKRRGRPQKPLKDGIDEDDIEKVGGEDDAKLNPPSKEVKGSTVANGKKRKRHAKANENSDLVKAQNGSEAESQKENSTSFNGFRHNGSRRKSTPRRAAEAGVECK
ncbi:hypothetical protein Cni_G00672 [Canna indica]|uniref:Uncharacterized protein n=1 Tax=Canna indica TaxID=4628 RepID=A0AAQ3JLN8_9LILI|nr:hypothetical protein Cni_G00672 [Canna indica]